MSNTEQLKIAMQTYNDMLEVYTNKTNKSNSTKLRNSLMEVNKLTKLCRKDVLDTQKAMPKQTRPVKKVQPEIVEEEQVVEPEAVEIPVVKVKKTRAKKI